MRLPINEWTVGPVAAAGTLLAVTEGSNEWTAKAYTAIGVAAVLVSGGILLLGRIDKAWMERRKTWEEFNRGSITEQLAESNENIKKMRGHLHELRDIEQKRTTENDSLHEDLSVMRQQFLDMAGALHAAEKDLREANGLIQTTLGDVKTVQQRLTECEDDRVELHSRIVKIEGVATTNAHRIDSLEGSGEHTPVK